MKLIVAILIALSFIGSPGAARAAPSVSCTMAGADEGMAPDHEKMGCCTPDCATPAPAAVLPGADVDEDAVDPVALLNARPMLRGDQRLWRCVEDQHVERVSCCRASRSGLPARTA